MAAWLQVENEQGNTTAPDGPAASCPFFVLQLGDLLDGFAAATALGSEATLERLLAEFGRLRCPVFHCLGGWGGMNGAGLERSIGGAYSGPTQNKTR